MVAPAQALETTELFNDYIKAGDDIECVAALEWRAMKLVRQQPRSLSARVCYGSILLDLAKRESAIEQFSVAEQLHDASTSAPRNLLAVGYANAGLYNKSLDAFRKLITCHGANVSESEFDNACRAAVLAGDVKELEALSRFDGPAASVAQMYLGVVAAGGLMEHLDAHQSIVRSIIQSRQCFAFVYPFQEEDETPALLCEYELLCDHKTRKALDRKIFDLLEDYYTSQGLSPGYYIGRLTTVLVPVSEYRQGEQAA